MSELQEAPDDSVDVEHEPDTGSPPKNIRSTRRIGERLYVAGLGAKPAKIMFVETSLLEEEAAETQFSTYGRTIRQKPRYLKGAPGAIFSDIAQLCGLNMREFYFTAMIKWLLPKAHRDKPKKDEIAWAQESFDNEIFEVKPDIIVCLGKPVFDYLTGLKVPLKDIKGAWFRSDRFNCRVFPMDNITRPVTKPEYTEKFRVELCEVKKMLDVIEGKPLIEITRQYTTTENMGQLRELVQQWDNRKLNIQSVDCEWGGNNHIDGKLRSIQFCWEAGFATYVKFRDEKGAFVFDADYKEAGALMGQHLNKPEVKYIGHHCAADLPWMYKWLDLDWYNKVYMDTEFGQQCIDEYEDLGLERMSIKHTDLGRYDIDVMLWYKKNKGDGSDGYAYVPDELLIPYGCYDVDCPFRATPVIMAELIRQDLAGYFFGTFLPFTTNVFTQYALTGLPMHKPRMDELRDLMSYARDEMNQILQVKITKEADLLMLSALMKEGPDEGLRAFQQIQQALQQAKPDQAFGILKEIMGIEKLKALQDFLDHRVDSPMFNIRSTDHMRRWLFDVKKLTPIKSTNRKEQGLPSMAWEKVMSYPPEKQKEFAPSTDKQSLEILGQGDALIGELLELNAVGNIVKAFLKEPTIDDDTGELTKENGLHFWLCTDGRIHGQLSTTETGRTRAWKPNILNFPSFVNRKIEDGIAKLLKQRFDAGLLPERFVHYLKDKVPSIRSCVDVQDIAPLEGSQGWCLVESDYKTAEVRGLAYISGDENMIHMCEDPDTQFGQLRTGNTGNDEEDLVPIRLGYASNCGIPVEKQDPRVILKLVKRKVVKDLVPAGDVPTGQTTNEYAFNILEAMVAKGHALPCDGKTYFSLEYVDFSSLEKLEDGTLRYADFDFHWNLAEMVNHMPREFMLKKIERAAGKVGNFQCIAEGEPVLTGRGWIPIQDVLCCDWLWDGVEWVHHDGIQLTGIKSVSEYQRLRATNNHEVWDTAERKISFGEATAQQAELAGPGREGCETFCRWPDHFPGDNTPAGKRLFLRADGMPALREAAGEGASQHGEGFLQQMSLSARRLATWLWEAKGDHQNIGLKIPGNDPTVQHGHTRVVPQLQGAGDKGPVQVEQGLCVMGAAALAERDFSQEGLRSAGQQRALLEEESSVGGSDNEPAERQEHSQHQHRACPSPEGEVSSAPLHGENVPGAPPLWCIGGGYYSEARAESNGRAEKVRVYDIINAGPRHRFVCSGMLVSNSAYGGAPATLERKIESDTGKKPEEGTGQALLDALQARQPIAMNYLKGVESIPEDPGFYRAASGRVRHFYTHPENAYAINGRMRRGIMAAMGREMRNYAMQNSVADTSARAANDMMEFGRKFKLDGVIMAILYDSIVTLCPLEERFVWAEAHDLFMRAKTGWKYHGRVLRYPVDTAFGRAWSTEADKEWKPKLYDATFAPTPVHYLPVLEHVKAEIAKYDTDPESSVPAR